MTGADAVDRSDPVTVSRLADDLRSLGVREDDTLLVHSSLSSLGWVPGGARAVVDALFDAVSAAGTLVMPTHSPQYADPTDWENSTAPDGASGGIRTSMAPYRPDVSPTRGMGAIPESFRSSPGVVRSRHPIYSFAARGADADAVVADHAYDGGLGEKSPLAAVYDRGGSVLLLGVGHDSDTSLHLAEHRARFDQTVLSDGAPVLLDGERAWIEFERPDYDGGDFADLGRAFERDRPDAVARGRVGHAEARLLDQRPLVEYAVEWFERTRR
ncbi:aminoglycoside N(3)-acetyltransferase [Halorussus marinus]|uniref:aminoglycoside N(3)-acetyltransferase n=1 Tax=Halorussus marinus TaxID=2505976 RepID=UPI001091FC9B|nr:AAC(3) family N-acetyltransferase [Halorussus marinus]